MSTKAMKDCECCGAGKDRMSQTCSCDTAELTRQRDQMTVMREALEIANACGGLCVECVRRINAALARCTP
jgi:hypothetical protein